MSFRPPPYPYDRLEPLAATAAELPGGVIDLSVGTPTDPPPAVVVEALTGSGSERGYPPSIGTPELREAASDWMARRLGVEVGPESVGATIGSKEFVAGLPHLLRLRSPERDVVLHPEMAYPSYAMGATLAGCRSVPVPPRADGRLDLDTIDPADAARAVCLWVCSPSNPSGVVEDLPAVVAWGREHGVPVISDECYVEFTWHGPPTSALAEGTDGVVVVHSLSKRSNLAGARVGFYAGDADLVEYLREVRKHAGFMCPGPSQAAAVAALADDTHVDLQRDRYRRRLERVAGLLGQVGVPAAMPDGAFYLFPDVAPEDAWDVARRLAREVGVLVSPGEFYGPAAASRLRVAVVQPDSAYDLLEERVTSFCGSDGSGSPSA